MSDKAARKQIEQEETLFLVKRGLRDLTAAMERLVEEVAKIRRLLEEGKSRLPGE
jgi:hypothetical protein